MELLSLGLTGFLLIVLGVLSLCLTPIPVIISVMLRGKSLIKSAFLRFTPFITYSIIVSVVGIILSAAWSSALIDIFNKLGVQVNSMEEITIFTLIMAFISGVVIALISAYSTSLIVDIASLPIAKEIIKH